MCIAVDLILGLSVLFVVFFLFFFSDYAQEPQNHTNIVLFLDQTMYHHKKKVQDPHGL